MFSHDAVPRTLPIKTITADPATNIAIHTIEQGKQALIFVNTRRSAEALAERIARATATSNTALHHLSETILSALSTPTKQCKRLAACVKKGVAFHHAGLAAKQRETIETAFREGKLAIVCATPTLAAGIDMPAYRAIIRDLKRFSGGWGMTPISVLEYHQMAGRAGRPGMEESGEAITIAATPSQKEDIIETFLKGEPEEITSKLAAEPALRVATLSLIATEYCTTTQALFDFFSKTFYAHQYGDMRKIHSIITRMLKHLDAWGFIITPQGHNDFVSAKDIHAGKLRATPLGRRVAELYLDPYTAHFIITGLRRATQKRQSSFAYLHLLASTLEMRPLLRVKTRELDEIQEKTAPHLDELYVLEPSMYEEEYEDFLASLKTALFLNDWCNEVTEDVLLDRYDIRPGEIHAKLERADWLCYAAEELCRLLVFKKEKAALAKLRLRLKHGAKEELFPLLKFKHIGRVRARKLFQNGVRDVTGVKKADYTALAQLLGPGVAKDLKKQVGQTVDTKAIGPRKRKGQTGLKTYQNKKKTEKKSK
ncbi:hypothetical protein D6783_05335 [Candidatus Woesearchaeota archaeon]|nr:MAG: hypothetical protein D6783_05335 [Candidatus Woesearchaeota archaeon]